MFNLFCRYNIFRRNARNLNIQVKYIKSIAKSFQFILNLFAVLLIGSSNCNWGKREWCATIANAIRCKVISHAAPQYNFIFFYDSHI